MVLTDIRIKDDNKITYMDDLNILCDLVGDSIVNGVQRQSLLRRVQCFRKGNWTHTYESPHYVHVNKTQVFDIEFFILDKKFRTPSFIK